MAYEDAGDRTSTTYQRKQLYEEIWRGKKTKGYSPYVLDFHTPLSKQVVTDAYGIMPEYQDEYKMALKMWKKFNVPFRE